MSRRTVGPPPRSWLADADDRDARENGWRDNPFGEKDEDRFEWKEPATEQDASYIIAAKVQHRLAQAVRSLIRRQGTTIEAVAHQIGMSEDGLGRILNGTYHANLTDLVRIANVLERDVRIRFRERPQDEQR